MVNVFTRSIITLLGIVFTLALVLMPVVGHTKELDDLKKNLQVQVLEFTQKSLNKVEKGIDTTLEQVPVVIQQYLTFQFIWHLILVIVFACFSACSIPIYRRIWTNDTAPDDEKLFLTITTSLLTFISMCFFFKELYKLLFLLTAPHVYLLKEFLKVIN